MNTDHVPDAIHRLRQGKRELHAIRVSMSLPEKVRQVVRLQAIVLPTLRRRREVHPWERVWPLDR
jgi:hypothetical protein